MDNHHHHHHHHISEQTTGKLSKDDTSTDNQQNGVDVEQNPHHQQQQCTKESNETAYSTMYSTATSRVLSIEELRSRQDSYYEFIHSLPRTVSPTFCGLLKSNEETGSEEMLAAKRRKIFESTKRKIDQCKTPERASADQTSSDSYHRKFKRQILTHHQQNATNSQGSKQLSGLSPVYFEMSPDEVEEHGPAKTTTMTTTTTSTKTKSDSHHFERSSFMDVEQQSWVTAHSHLTTGSPATPEFNWSIDQMARLCPAEFTVNEEQFMLHNAIEARNISLIRRQSDLYFKQDLIVPSPAPYTPLAKRKRRMFDTIYPVQGPAIQKRQTLAGVQLFDKLKEAKKVRNNQLDNLSWAEESPAAAATAAASTATVDQHCSDYLIRGKRRLWRSMESLKPDEPLRYPILFAKLFDSSWRQPPMGDNTMSILEPSMSVMMTSGWSKTANSFYNLEMSHQPAHCSLLNKTGMSLNLSAIDTLSPIVRQHPVSANFDLSPICARTELTNAFENTDSGAASGQLQTNENRPSSRTPNQNLNRSSSSSASSHITKMATPSSMDGNKIIAYKLMHRNEHNSLRTPARRNFKLSSRNSGLVKVEEGENEMKIVKKETLNSTASDTNSLEFDRDSGCHVKRKFNGFTSTPNRH